MSPSGSVPNQIWPRKNRKLINSASNHKRSPKMGQSTENMHLRLRATKCYLSRRHERSYIFMHNPIGLEFRSTKNLTVLKHKDPFLTNLLAISSLSHDIRCNSGFLPRTRLGFPALSLSSVISVLLRTEEIQNIVRLLPRRARLGWEITTN